MRKKRATGDLGRREKKKKNQRDSKRRERAVTSMVPPLIPLSNATTRELKWKLRGGVAVVIVSVVLRLAGANVNNLGAWQPAL